MPEDRLILYHYPIRENNIIPHKHQILQASVFHDALRRIVFGSPVGDDIDDESYKATYDAVQDSGADKWKLTVTAFQPGCALVINEEREEVAKAFQRASAYLKPGGREFIRPLDRVAYLMRNIDRGDIVVVPSSEIDLENILYETTFDKDKLVRTLTNYNKPLTKEELLRLAGRNTNYRWKSIESLKETLNRPTQPPVYWST